MGQQSGQGTHRGALTHKKMMSLVGAAQSRERAGRGGIVKGRWSGELHERGMCGVVAGGHSMY